MSRIGYRFYNDGDQLGIGYGKETCNPAGRFLGVKGNDKIAKLTADAWAVYSEEAYEKVLDILCGAVADYVEQNPDLRNQPTEDMWDFKDEEEDQDLSLIHILPILALKMYIIKRINCRNVHDHSALYLSNICSFISLLLSAPDGNMHIPKGKKMCIRDRHKPFRIAVCKNCGREFHAVDEGKRQRKFCSLNCYWDYRYGMKGVDEGE